MQSRLRRAIPGHLLLIIGVLLRGALIQGVDGFLLARRVIATLKPWSRQATELPVDALLDLPQRRSQKPLVAGGPMWPFLIAALMVLWMWSGLEARSARLSQLKNDERKGAVVYTVGVRKSQQDGRRRPRVVALTCTCAAHRGCPHCLSVEYLKRRENVEAHICLSPAAVAWSVPGL